MTVCFTDKEIEALRDLLTAFQYGMSDTVDSMLFSPKWKLYHKAFTKLTGLVLTTEKEAMEEYEKEKRN